MCVGVNGVDVSECRVADGAVELTLTSPFPWKRKAVVTVRGAAPGRRFALKPLGDVAPIIEAGGIFEYAKQSGML